MTRSREDLVVTFCLHFHADGDAVGRFTAAGAVSDSGSAVARLVVAPCDGVCGDLSADITLYGGHGMITWLVSGVTYPLGAPRTIVCGSARTGAGTGDYRDLATTGRFVAATDSLASTLTGALDVTAWPGVPGSPDGKATVVHR